MPAFWEHLFLAPLPNIYDLFYVNMNMILIITIEYLALGASLQFQFQFQIFISDLVIDHRIPSQLGGQVDFAI